MSSDEDGLLSGMKQFKFMRACYGMAVSSAIGMLVTAYTRPEPMAKQRGLVWGTSPESLGSGTRAGGVSRCLAVPIEWPSPPAKDEAFSRTPIRISASQARQLGVESGDPLFITDTRWWLGGLKSTQAVVESVDESGDAADRIGLPAEILESMVSPRRRQMPLRVERVD